MSNLKFTLDIHTLSNYILFLADISVQILTKFPIDTLAFLSFLPKYCTSITILLITATISCMSFCYPVVSPDIFKMHLSQSSEYPHFTASRHLNHHCTDIHCIVIPVSWFNICHCYCIMIIVFNKYDILFCQMYSSRNTQGLILLSFNLLLFLVDLETAFKVPIPFRHYLFISSILFTSFCNSSLKSDKSSYVITFSLIRRTISHIASDLLISMITPG